MTNSINDYRPSTWDEYLEQDGAANYLKSVIKTNKHPSGLIISGGSGSGKTTIAQLYVKATLCEQRLEHDFQPCNHCSSCSKTIHKNQHPNITYYSITEASVFKEAVSDLISLTKSTTVLTHDNVRHDNNRRFIIIDEVQSASRQSISPFLDSLEFALDNVTVILISMDLDKMDSIVREAIESRCIELSLSPISSSSISSKLQFFYSDLHPSCADLIAYLSNGNVRKAWQTLQYFITKSEGSLSLLTPSHISSEKLGGLNLESCHSLLLSLQSNSWDNTSSFFKTILTNEEVAISYFLSFLVSQNLNLEGIHFLSSLSFWLQSSYKIPVVSIFKLYQGKCLLSLSSQSQSQSQSLNQSQSQSPPQSLNVVKVSKLVTSQLEKLVGKPLTSKPIKMANFSFTTWSEYLKYYVNN